MATYYWVDGSGTWKVGTKTNWSLTSGGGGGAGVPTVNDTAIFDWNSGMNGDIVTFGAGAVCYTLEIRDANGIRLNLAARILTICGGGLTAQTYSYLIFSYTTGVINFTGNASGSTTMYIDVPTATTVNLPHITITGGTYNVSTTVELLDDIACETVLIQCGGTYGILTTFNSNGWHIDCSGFKSTLPTGIGNDIKIFLAGGGLVCKGVDNGLIHTFDVLVSDITSSGYTPPGSLNISNTSGSLVTIVTTDNLPFTHVLLQGVNYSIESNLDISGDLTINPDRASTLSTTSGKTISVAGLLSIDGHDSTSNLLTLISSVPGSPAYFVASDRDVHATNVSIADNYISGGYSYYALISGGNVDARGNSGWVFHSLRGPLPRFYNT